MSIFIFLLLLLEKVFLPQVWGKPTVSIVHKRTTFPTGLFKGDSSSHLGRISTISSERSPATTRRNITTTTKFRKTFNFFLSTFGLNHAVRTCKGEKNLGNIKMGSSKCGVKYQRRNLGKRVLPRRVNSRRNITTTTKFRKTFNFFLSTFGLNHAVRICKGEKNSDSIKRSYPKCGVKYERRNLGKRVLPRRLKIGYCAASHACTSSDVMSSCQPSRVVFKRIFVKRCIKRKTRTKSQKKVTAGESKKLRRKTRRCRWKQDVILSAVSCKCACRNP